MKRIITVLVAAALLLSCLTACGGKEEAVSSVEAGFGGEITVVSREEGSGTRGAFVELMGVETDEGDMTVETAEISNSTSVVTQTVAGNPGAIGYISMGALGDTVKALKVDGVEATVEKVKSGSYAVARPFVLCYREENLTELGKDFLSFIMSKEGQSITQQEGYIAVDEGAASYESAGLSGTLSLNGSTSVAPVMEVLAESYRELNPGVTVDIQQTGSGAGITATVDGSCEIGMSSRALKDEELAEGLTEITMAMDGIAVIVNTENPAEGLTSEEIRRIFVGEITTWDQIG